MPFFTLLVLFLQQSIFVHSLPVLLLDRVQRIKRKSAHENENCAVSFARSMTLTKQTSERGINFSGQRFQSHCELRRLTTTRIVETNALFKYSGWNYPDRRINMSVRIEWRWFHPENDWLHHSNFPFIMIGSIQTNSLINIGTSPKVESCGSFIRAPNRFSRLSCIQSWEMNEYRIWHAFALEIEYKLKTWSWNVNKFAFRMPRHTMTLNRCL